MKIIYVRFGPVPECGFSLNHKTKQPEAGVSVYECLVRGKKLNILLPTMDTQSLDTISSCYNVCQGARAYIDQELYEVEGDLVGTGSDGEPLLSNCRIVRQIFDRTLEQRPRFHDYLRFCDEALEEAGAQDHDWNCRYVRALEKRGLRISLGKEKSEEYPKGVAQKAPLPRGFKCAWGLNSFIVWA